jgi:hypothetical protein
MGKPPAREHNAWQAKWPSPGSPYCDTKTISGAGGAFDLRALDGTYGSLTPDVSSVPMRGQGSCQMSVLKVSANCHWNLRSSCNHVVSRRVQFLCADAGNSVLDGQQRQGFTDLDRRNCAVPHRRRKVRSDRLWGTDDAMATNSAMSAFATRRDNPVTNFRLLRDTLYQQSQ